MGKLSMTVVIPAHNEEKYAARCIRSVKRSVQAYGGFEELKAMEDAAAAKS